MDEKNMIEILSKPSHTFKAKKICSCGKTQPHQAQWCSDCGEEYIILAKDVPLFQKIINLSTKNKHYSRDNGAPAFIVNE